MTGRFMYNSIFFPFYKKRIKKKVREKYIFFCLHATKPIKDWISVTWKYSSKIIFKCANNAVKPSFKIVFGEKKNTCGSREQYTRPTVLITNADANPNLAVSKLSLNTCVYVCLFVCKHRYVCDLLIEAGCFEQCKSIERSWLDLFLADSSSIIQSASYLIFIGSLSFRLVGCSWLIESVGMLEFPKN